MTRPMDRDPLHESRFREILGVAPDAGREEIRRAYRRLVMENHPDRFPSADKSVQDMRMIVLNEAYAHLMTWTSTPAGDTVRPGDPRAGAEPRGGHNGRAPAGAQAAPRDAIGRLKDPAYAYYKQGFLNYSLAVHGIAAANQAAARGKLPHFRPYRVSQDFANSLELLNAAHAYFTRVADNFPDSVWNADACVKLKRIERFTKLYRKILANVSGK
jgi:hypothetical protein